MGNGEEVAGYNREIERVEAGFIRVQRDILFKRDRRTSVNDR